jgi:hypothetical protein
MVAKMLENSLRCDLVQSALGTAYLYGCESGVSPNVRSLLQPPATNPKGSNDFTFCL